ncbi:MAG TPA: amino acid adenylation domain-containing protein [Pseudonocardiaceae bacterium]
MPDVTLPSLFEAQVAADPHGVALRSDLGSLSFAELNARANRLAHLFIEHGVGPERVVAVALPRSVEMIVAFMAVLKAGGIYLPLDPTYPPERNAFMLDDARPVVLLTTEELGGRYPDLVAGHRLYWSELDLDGRPDTDPTDADRDLPLCAAHPIYLIYTSGSTGRPKGVLMPGSSLVNLIDWHAANLPSEPGTRIAQLAAIGFDVSMHEILATLVLGKCLVVPTDEIRKDPVRLAGWLADHEVRQVFLPTVLIEALCEAARVRGIALDSLTDIIQSGEPLTVRQETREYLRERANLVLRNHYGSAEMQDVAVWSARTATETIPSPAPIGRAISRTNAYVLEADLLPADVGDLYISGPGLARGYLRRPGLTADRFLPDPFGLPGARMYRTGDVVRREADGDLVYLGRADNQVKVHGFRVELGEIEARLVARADVASAIVVPRELTAGHRQLVAYLLAAPDAQPVPDRVRAELADELPAHMVPAAVVVVDEFPLAPSGKVDVRALPEPVMSAGSAGRAGTRAEQILVEVFADVLGVPSVGVEDNFFALGGDSISVLRLVLAARRAGLAITTNSVFELGTPRGLAAAAGAASAGVRAGHDPLIWLGERQLRRLQVAAPWLAGIAPVSPLQQGFLFHSIRDDRGDTYAEALVLTLAGQVDGARLRGAASALLARHASLRSGFFLAGLPEPVAVTMADVPLSFAETDLTDLDVGLATERAEEVARQDLLVPFDVERPPLLRLHLIQLGPKEHQLVITYHHILLDGWSVAVLVRELLALYHDEPLPPVPDPVDHLRWLRAQDDESAEEAWRAALDGVSSPTMLVDAGSSRAPTMPAKVVVELSEQDTDRLGAVTRRLNLTVNTAVQGMWAMLLGEETGRRDIVFGSTVSGRAPEIPGVENMIGLLINTVPVVVRLGDGSVGELLGQVQAEQARLGPHQHLGLGRLQRLAGWTSEFDTLIVFENTDLQPATILTEGGDPQVVDVRLTEYTHYPISIIGTPGSRLRLSVSYQPDLFDEHRVRGLVERLAEMLAGIDPDQPVNGPR